MKYPTRSIQHIMETQSFKLLSNLLPDRWLIRNITERDYGIDCYVEFVSNNLEVTGKLASIQLKSCDKIEYLKTSPKESTLSNISIKTTNYWYEFPVPVFLIYADLESQDALVLSVKSYVRANFSKYLDQTILPYKFNIDANINKPEGYQLLESLYSTEIGRNKFEYIFIDFVCDFDHLLEILDYHQQRDHFLELESEENMRLISLYSKVKFLSDYFNAPWNLSLDDLLLDAQSKFNEKRLHELQASDIVKSAASKLIELFISMEILFDKEDVYWSRWAEFSNNIYINWDELKNRLRPFV